MKKFHFIANIWLLTLCCIFLPVSIGGQAEQLKEHVIPHFIEALDETQHHVAVIEPVSENANIKMPVSTGIFVNADGGVIASLTAIAGADKIFVRKFHSRRRPADVFAIDQSYGLVFLKTPFNIEKKLPPNVSSSSVGEWVLVTYVTRTAENDNYRLGLFPALIASKNASVQLIGKKHTSMLKLNARAPFGAAAAPVYGASGHFQGLLMAVKECPMKTSDCSYVLSAEKLKEITARLEKGESTRLGWLGIALKPLEKQNQGAKIAAVMKNYPADEAGLKPGDIIREVDGSLITSPAALQSLICDLAPDTEVELRIDRKGEFKDVNVTLGKRPLMITVLP